MTGVSDLLLLDDLIARRSSNHLLLWIDQIDFELREVGDDQRREQLQRLREHCLAEVEVRAPNPGPYGDSRAGRLLNCHPRARDPARYEELALVNERAAAEMPSELLGADLADERGTDAPHRGQATRGGILIRANGKCSTSRRYRPPAAEVTFARSRAAGRRQQGAAYDCPNDLGTEVHRSRSSHAGGASF